MTATKTRRQKVVAMAEQAASPAEAEVAKAMLANMTDDRPRLEVIADEVKFEYGKGIDAQFAIGNLLKEARTLLTSKVEYGAWLKAQEFPFSYEVSWALMKAAENEPAVRAIAEGRKSTGLLDVSIASIVKNMDRKPKPSHTELTGEVEPVTDTTPVDPAYAAMRTAHRLLVEEDGFANMHVEDMAKVAGFVKDIAAAYTAAKLARNA